MKLEYVVNTEKNIKEILKGGLNISERLYKKVKNDRVFINGSRIDYKTLIQKNDKCVVDLDFEEDNSNIIPNQSIEFEILYEDEWMLIVNKPAGITVHPSINHYETSLSNGIKYYYNSNNIHKILRPINRLDKDTSGIVIFAKSEYIQDNLTNYTKEYIAIVDGILEGRGTINKPIDRKNSSIIERCISDTGEKAITHYEVIKTIDAKYTIVKCLLETGRTHQIRVHMASIGHPLLGDTLYGSASSLIKRQALHAYHINFIHPVSKKEIDVISELPIDMQKTIKGE